MKVIDDKATPKQTWALFLTTGIDCRNCNLTKESAAELITTAQTDPKKAFDLLLELGGELKCEQNIKYAIRRVEKKGVAFKSRKTPRLIINSRSDKKIQEKIRRKIKILAKEAFPKFKTEQEAFISIAEALNKSGYRCCDGSEWKYKSAYDFYRRSFPKKLKINTKSPVVKVLSTHEIESSVGINKDTLIKHIIESNIDVTSKVRLITII